MRKQIIAWKHLMKIFSKNPHSSSRRTKRTIAFTLCAVIGSTAVAVDGVKVNPYLAKNSNSTTTRPSGRVPSYARQPVSQINVGAASHSNTIIARPTRLPTVAAGDHGETVDPGTQNSTKAIEVAAQPVQMPWAPPAQAPAATQQATKIAKLSSRAPNAINLSPTLTDSRLNLPATPPIKGQATGPIKAQATAPIKAQATARLSAQATPRINTSATPQLGHPVAMRSPDETWLRSSTASSHRRDARRLLDQALQEYNVGAWASAEASAWNSLRRSAEGLDIAGSASRATESASAYLGIARTAIREARDFSGVYGDLSSAGVGRIARSHRTAVLKNEQQAVTATDAIDRYLNAARLHLSRIAAARVEAAEAMDLIAAIHLSRNEPRTLPNETSLCLRRAALQGQPHNASLALRLGMQLADLGLDQEAQWALGHSMSIEPTREAAETLAVVLQRSGDRDAAARIAEQAKRRFAAVSASSAPRVPEVTHLTPQQFASVSPSVIMPSDRLQTVQANLAAQPGNDQNAVLQPASYRPDAESEDREQEREQEKTNPIKATAKRLLTPFGKLW